MISRLRRSLREREARVYSGLAVLFAGLLVIAVGIARYGAPAMPIISAPLPGETALPQAASYRVEVATLPDAPLSELILTIEDNAGTVLERKPVELHPGESGVFVVAENVQRDGLRLRLSGLGGETGETARIYAHVIAVRRETTAPATVYALPLTVPAAEQRETVKLLVPFDLDSLGRWTKNTLKASQDCTASPCVDVPLTVEGYSKEGVLVFQNDVTLGMELEVEVERFFPPEIASGVVVIRPQGEQDSIPANVKAALRREAATDEVTPALAIEIDAARVFYQVGGGCTPTCPANGCNVEDGCGGICSCPEGLDCSDGMCIAPACPAELAVYPQVLCSGRYELQASDGSSPAGVLGGTVELEAAQGEKRTATTISVSGEEGNFYAQAELSLDAFNGAETVTLHCRGELRAQFEERVYGASPFAYSRTFANLCEVRDAALAGPVSITGEEPVILYEQCVPQCQDKSCGSDGCGGSCGECDPSLFCTAEGTCRAPCMPDCTNKCPGTSDGCEGTCTEACPMDRPECIDGQCRAPCVANCSYKCNGAPDGCGGQCWDACPGDMPRCIEQACAPSCDGNCGGRMCGDDGCGGSCGSCSPGYACSSSGECVCEPDCTNKCNGAPDGCGGSCWTGCEGNKQCIEGVCVGGCEPECAGKQCGDDGCGGSCGACPEHYACSYDRQCRCEAQCPAGYCGADGCGGICECAVGEVCQGSQCKDQCSFWREIGDYLGIASCECPSGCASGEVCVNGSCVPGCQSDCSGKQCGEDGCGGSCGSCEWNMTCSGGQCMPVCEPSCENRCNGADDGCGGQCWSGCPGDRPQCINGTCESCAADCTDKCNGADDGCGGQCWTFCSWERPNCVDNRCVQGCQGDCSSRTCGDDGCGGSCGSCAEGLSCTDGQCVPGYCEPECRGKCGGAADGCGGSCWDSCQGGECVDGRCVEICQPQCEGKQCGDDGCGGSCGSCADGLTCSDGQCSCRADCTDKCNGAADGCGGYCNITCGEGLVCTDGRCVPVCQGDCDGKQCGDNGCGGSCGSCSEGETCSDGSCVPSCTPGCAGKCGGDDNGCGGSCPNPCAWDETCSGGVCERCAGNCAGKCAGESDGCGGTCPNPCSMDESCSGGICTKNCAPNCAGKCAGEDNGCQGQCPNPCRENETCSGGVCQCNASCAGKCAGEEDGCGGTCPNPCQDGETCVGGECKDICYPECEGKSCGEDGCGGECPPGCGENETCEEGACFCKPDCTKKCSGANDGCGGICLGECGEGEECVQQECVNCIEAAQFAAQINVACAGNYQLFDENGVEVWLSSFDGVQGLASAEVVLEQGETRIAWSLELDETSFGGEWRLAPVAGASYVNPTWFTRGIPITVRCRGHLGVRTQDSRVFSTVLNLEKFFPSACHYFEAQAKETVNLEAGLRLTPCSPSCSNGACNVDDLCGGTCACPHGYSCENNRCERPCMPDCNGRCGGVADGCGGVCDWCPEGSRCMGTTCECTPDCNGKLCGDDGCGGSCGTCEGDKTCISGYCLSCGCFEGQECGTDGCGASCGSGCGGEDVCESGRCVTPCTPNCDGKECGSDGCNGSCGGCPAEKPFCTGNTCQGECVSDCSEKCGGESDGCGGVCPDPCAGGTCHDGQCCTPSCSEKDCGDDGCGGSCGDCPATAPYCNKNKCEEICGPNCDGTTCGSDGCGGWCTCAEPLVCRDSKCVCEPECASKECGEDGCGGFCGLCVNGQQCVDGECRYCTPSCPEGVECGSDGCGGRCGTCAATQACVAGRCVCEPDWECTTWGTCVEDAVGVGHQTRACQDNRSCGTTEGQPAEEQTCQVCYSDWSCGEWTPCWEGMTERRCTDLNGCAQETIEREHCTCNDPYVCQSRCGKVRNKCNDEVDCGACPCIPDATVCFGKCGVVDNGCGENVDCGACPCMYADNVPCDCQSPDLSGKVKMTTDQTLCDGSYVSDASATENKTIQVTAKIESDREQVPASCEIRIKRTAGSSSEWVGEPCKGTKTCTVSYTSKPGDFSDDGVTIFWFAAEAKNCCLAAPHDKASVPVSTIQLLMDYKEYDEGKEGCYRDRPYKTEIKYWPDCLTPVAGTVTGKPSRPEGEVKAYKKGPMVWDVKIEDNKVQAYQLEAWWYGFSENGSTLERLCYDYPNDYDVTATVEFKEGKLRAVNKKLRASVALPPSVKAQNASRLRAASRINYGEQRWDGNGYYCCKNTFFPTNPPPFLFEDTITVHVPNQYIIEACEEEVYHSEQHGFLTWANGSININQPQWVGHLSGLSSELCLRPNPGEAVQAASDRACAGSRQGLLNKLTVELGEVGRAYVRAVHDRNVNCWKEYTAKQRPGLSDMMGPYHFACAYQRENKPCYGWTPKQPPEPTYEMYKGQ